MVDFVGTVVTAALMVLAVNVLTTFVDIPRAAKLTLAGANKSLDCECRWLHGDHRAASGHRTFRWLPLASRSHRRNRRADGDRWRELKRHIIRMLDGIQLSEGV